MVRHIIDQANWSHGDLDAGSAENVRANRRGFRAHVALVDLVEDYLLQNRSMTTVLDLLG
ncbi:hypothetical protein QQY66_44595 [Streptomyces sp. DG2A-72]|uniref:hypothetical protein n=1 Tax=Streptomyces sp. DG2A-72 TaxID=3051386 RepID=UPI00265C17B6|nr:hypothetical protein [Streptomyces sp. DG2A-72]MDO0938464.1 hypothetical protein [Streptomyces sp. DG2A-72]